MTEFLQLHVLTSYPPANLNRDDLGRPKTAVFGGKNRLRISSQSLKRAWRQSPVFQEAVGSHRGSRTREIGKQWVLEPLERGGMARGQAEQAAQKIAATFGKLEDGKPGVIKQLAHVSPEEKAAIDALVATLLAEKRLPTDDECKLLRHDHRAADIALFGRMLADSPAYNVEAAAQVAHAITVYPVAIEDDFFTAVDDLNTRLEDVGAGHMGETEFGAGIFYLYVCIDCDRLRANLGGDGELASRTLRGLTESACTIAPSGKQNSFASRAYASVAVAERGDRQPRSLSVAFLRGPRDGEPADVETAAAKLERQLASFDQVYGPLARERYAFSVPKGEGSLAGLLDFVAAAKGVTA